MRARLAKALLLSATVCGLFTASVGAFRTVGHVPYRTCSTCSLIDTGITYNDNPNLATVDFFTSTHYFGSDATWFVGNGSRHMIDAEESGLIALGDVQDLGESTKVLINDFPHTVTLQASVVLPELPNCARLSTDSSGKIICGESASQSVKRLSSEVASLRKKVSAYSKQ